MAWRASKIFDDSQRRLIAIESVDFDHGKSGGHYRLYAKIEPKAVVVCDTDDTYALDLECGKISLDRLRQNIPELDAVLARLCKTRLKSER